MVSVGANSLSEIPWGLGHGVQETPEPRIRHPSCFLLGGQAEVLRDENAVNVDESPLLKVSEIRKRRRLAHGTQGMVARDSAP